MKRIFGVFFLIITAAVINAQMKPEETEDWSRKPAIVTPGKMNQPPSDAIVLYGGAKDIVNWVSDKGSPVNWIADSALTVVPKTGSIKTVRSFGDCQLHIEWRTPSVVSGTSQGR